MREVATDDDDDDDDEVRVIQSGALQHVIGRIDPQLLNKLMSHQRECALFCLDRFAAGRGVIVALTMGMGKTLTALAVCDAIAHQSKQLYVLVIAPATIVTNWSQEFDLWSFSNIKTMNVVLKLEFAEKCSVRNAQRTGGIVVVSTEMFRLHSRVFGQPSLVVVDEGHRLKNSKTQLMKALQTLETPCRLVLTGTPLQNNLSECYSIVNWVHRSRGSQSASLKVLRRRDRTRSRKRCDRHAGGAGSRSSAHVANASRRGRFSSRRHQAGAHAPDQE